MIRIKNQQLQTIRKRGGFMEQDLLSSYALLYAKLVQLREEVESLQEEEALFQEEMNSKANEWDESCFSMNRL